MLSLPRPRSCHAPLTPGPAAPPTTPAAPRSPAPPRPRRPGGHPAPVPRPTPARRSARAGCTDVAPLLRPATCEDRQWYVTRVREGECAMATKPPKGDPVQDAPQVGEPKRAAAGLPAIGHTLRMAHQQMGVRRTALTLLNVNQQDGFDCPGCAWPEPEHPHRAEFCENGAKAVAEEATLRRVTPEFFARHPVSDLAGRSGYWLGQQGRLTHPVYLPEGGDHYEPVTWERAFDIVAEEIDALSSPDEAVFYTSGRTSNEAAFLYQLFARELGTNNLPDCSNLCHESSGSALSETIGVGKGSVLLEDLYQADLIIVAGQNPGTNHPRMLSALEKAKANGARIISVNPLPEAGL